MLRTTFCFTILLGSYAFARSECFNSASSRLLKGTFLWIILLLPLFVLLGYAVFTVLCTDFNVYWLLMNAILVLTWYLYFAWCLTCLLSYLHWHIKLMIPCYLDAIYSRMWRCRGVIVNKLTKMVYWLNCLLLFLLYVPHSRNIC